MVQREVKNKTKLYTLAAVLSAVILVSAIYTVTTPVVMYGALGMSPMKHFNSIDELRNYLTTNTQQNTEYQYSLNSEVISFFTDVAPTSSAMPAAKQSTLGGGGSDSDWSGTNIQVAGVDEADIVKTDGKYIYALNYNYNRGFGSGSNIIQIVNANPSNPVVVGKIVFEESTYVSGMYLSNDGNKLAVIGSVYPYYDIIVPLNENIASDTSEPVPIDTPSIFWPYNHETFIHVYDVSNKANPVLTRSVTLSGYYVNSRMVGNYVYLIVSQQVYAEDEIVYLPRVSVDAVTKDIAPTSIYYADIQDYSFSYTIFNSINIMNDVEQPTSMTILTGASSCMYASINNIYVTFNKYESTELYRISFNGANLSFRAQGTVPGYVLNQYSMDEYNNHFRIATTVSTGPWNSRTEYNNLYVLNMNLDTVGKIENLAEGERIYSARFAGDKAYLVTFEQIDPFFVLDLKNPSAPKVAGELKIPGFSNYLHPYSENYIIGLGREDDAVKLSLFDVTDMSNPVEIAKYLIHENNAWIHSTALHEPKAFLFDQQKQLLVIPIEINYPGYWEIEPTPIPRPEPTPLPEIINPDNSSTSDSERSPVIYDSGLWRNGDFWSGVYAFNVSPENGFTLQSALSHKPTINNQDWWYSSVSRSLYIGNTLYTISNEMIQLSSLDNFRVITRVIF
ncbi:MAG: beta-propeller domain-containing protein [Candidatus Bathyarchaeota archaeon]|nr:beta-propeller domain-containing protein [Candidatus Termiticorpusculum sp.]